MMMMMMMENYHWGIELVCFKAFYLFSHSLIHLFLCLSNHLFIQSFMQSCNISLVFDLSEITQWWHRTMADGGFISPYLSTHISHIPCSGYVIAQWNRSCFLFLITGAATSAKGTRKHIRLSCPIRYLSAVSVVSYGLDCADRTCLAFTHTMGSKVLVVSSFGLLDIS